MAGTTVIVPKITGYAAFDPTAIAITGGTITGTNVPSFVATAIPFVRAPTGTMANNGAVTLGTALPRIIGKCFMWFPAGAIATSVPVAASWLYTEMSSTTVGIVYNNTYTSGIPALPSKTAFVSTGPGAFTGDTTQVSGPALTITGGTLGANGMLFFESLWSNNNSAGTKTCKVFLGGTGGTAFFSDVFTTSTQYYDVRSLQNAGAQNVQIAPPASAGPIAFKSAINLAGAIDFSTDQVFVPTMTGNTATDWQIIEHVSYELLFRA